MALPGKKEKNNSLSAQTVFRLSLRNIVFGGEVGGLLIGSFSLTPDLSWGEDARVLRVETEVGPKDILSKFFAIDLAPSGA